MVPGAQRLVTPSAIGYIGAMGGVSLESAQCSEPAQTARRALTDGRGIRGRSLTRRLALVGEGSKANARVVDGEGGPLGECRE